jgi:hypothetical protein
VARLCAKILEAARSPNVALAPKSPSEGRNAIDRVIRWTGYSVLRYDGCVPLVGAIYNAGQLFTPEILAPIHFFTSSPSARLSIQ